MESDIAQWYQQILSSQAPQPLREMVSRGLVPFPGHHMLEVLAVLARDPEESIRLQAALTLRSLPRQMLITAAGDRALHGPIIRQLSRLFATDIDMLARLAVNPSTPDEVLRAIAGIHSPVLLEAVGRNLERVRRDPDLLVRLLDNPVLSPTLKSYLLEERNRQEAAARMESEEEAKEILVEEPEFNEVLVKNFEHEDAVLPAPHREAAVEKRHQTIFQLVRQMNAGERLILAMKGNREARYMLVRDANKQVACKVLESPRISDIEIEMFAKMTNVCAEVLRGIAAEKQWMGKYSIVKALAFNAKTPIDLSLPMVNKLQTRDLGFMARNRNISEVVRTTAGRLFKMRREARS